jgi:hypothetical protein
MLEKVSTHTSENEPAERGIREAYSTEVRLQVVEDWLETGILKRAAEKNGISYITAKVWKSKPWWKDFEDEILAQRRIGTQNKIGGIVEKGLDVVQDRLEHGEFYVQKDGTLNRRPVGLRDASTAINGLMQRQSILEKQNEKHGNKEATKSIEQHLASLAEEFAKFNNRSKSGAQSIEFVEKPV